MQNSAPPLKPRRHDGDHGGAGNDGESAEIIELIELLFYAYRDFVSDPDEILAVYGFGRAHHRVIHFVGRNPGISVAELLDILQITKQSLGRVLKQLIADDFIQQREGARDRRQRLLFLTETGADLAQRLMAPQIERVARAVEQAGPQARAHYRTVLYNLINEEDRAGIAAGRTGADAAQTG